MSKIMFTISYDINPEKRDDYLALSQRMKQHLAQSNGKNYSIYEQKTRKNSFTEVFVCNSKEEYDLLEDQDEVTSQMVQQLDSLLVNSKMKYSTLVEVD